MLLANIADNTAWLVWSKTKQAEKGRGRPDPISRPGVRKPEKDPEIQLMDIDELKAYLARPRADLGE